MEGRYANAFQVGHNAFEFVLEFGQAFPESERAWFHSRIITTPAYARMLFETLQEALEQYERTYGMVQ
jgi:hypothetical protein